MQAHAMLTPRERGMMCWRLNYRKLTLEASKDLLSQQPPKL